MSEETLSKRVDNLALEVARKINERISASQDTVAKWGFTKNTGTYSKPALGIPYDDLSDEVQEKLDEKELPVQTGQTNKFLTTDGTTPFWSSVDAFPDQTNNSGKVLITDGTSTHWTEYQNLETNTDPAFHNSVYRGKYLGNALTTAQSSTIQAGEFNDMYIGDYWTIDGVNWRIASFDYYYHTGYDANDSNNYTKTHHLVIVPDEPLYYTVMNDTNVTTGAYVGSKMYSIGLNEAKTKIQTAFGASHILSIRQYFSNTVTNGYESAGDWYDASVWLMTEPNVYGCKHFGNCEQGTSLANNYTIDNRQYPLFRYWRPRQNRTYFWLRDVASATTFCDVHSTGSASANNAYNSYGVRPAFCLI